MKLTRKLIEALITEEERVKFKTTYEGQDCRVLIGCDYFLVEFTDGHTLQQNRKDIESGGCFPYNDCISVYTTIVKVSVSGELWFEDFTNLETI